jgi:hypothetical protein
MAAIDKALPASVPPTPPTSTKSTSFAFIILSASYVVTPKAPQAIPPPIHFPIVIMSGFKFIALVAPP